MSAHTTVAAVAAAWPGSPVALRFRYGRGNGYPMGVGASRCITGAVTSPSTTPSTKRTAPPGPDPVG